MEERTYSRVDSLETLDAVIKRVRAAQKLYASYSQEQVDDKIRGGIKTDDGCEIQKRSEQ